MHYMKGKYQLDKKFKMAGVEHCFVSEITVAELMYGVENSDRRKKNQQALDNLLTEN